MFFVNQLAGFGAGGVAEIVASGLHLHLDAGNSASYSGSGTTWTDLTSNAYTFGQSGSGTTFTSSGAASYFQFNGSGWWTQSAAYSGSIMRIAGRQNQPFTTEAWIYRGGAANDLEALWSNMSGSGTSAGYSDVVNYTGNKHEAYVQGSSQGLSTSQVGTGAWKQIALSGQLDGSTTCTFYVNGAADGTFNYNNSAFTSGDSAASSTLCSWATTFPFSNGSRIAIFRQYNRALTGAEVLQNFNANRARYGI